jgi:hypothetical protein
MPSPPSPPSSAPETAAAWVERWERAERDNRVLAAPTVESLVQAGLDRIAVQAYVAVRVPGQNEQDALLRLPVVLRWLATGAEDLSLDAAMRWAWVVATGYRDGLLPTDVIPAWLRAGLGETGWLFLAAGLSVQEAADQVSSGDPVDTDGLRMLAALRGVTLPY